METSPATAANNNQSTDKVLAILELLARSCEPLRLVDIAKLLHYNTSTALRFLNSLEQNGYITKDKETFKYHMTYKIVGLASMVTSHSDLVSVASPYIRELSSRLRECACLAIEQNYSVLYIYVADGPGQILRTTQRIGKEAPMHCTGVGKLILSDFSENRIDEMIAQKGLPKFTTYTLTTKEALLEDLSRIRTQGYAYDNEECELGARCISFPVRNYTENIIASISVTGPVGRMTDEFIATNFHTIKDSADAVSYQLGYQL